MAYKQNVIVKLEELSHTQDDINRLLRRQEIFLTLHPVLGKKKPEKIQDEISSLILATEKQEKRIGDLLFSLKGASQDVY